LDSKEDYHIIPLLLDLNFDIKPLIEKSLFKLPGLISFQIEPFLNGIIQPDPNIETGMSFLLKVGISPEDRRFQSYIKGGLGTIYISQHTLE